MSPICLASFLSSQIFVDLSHGVLETLYDNIKCIIKTNNEKHSKESTTMKENTDKETKTSTGEKLSLLIFVNHCRVLAAGASSANVDPHATVHKTFARFRIPFLETSQMVPALPGGRSVISSLRITSTAFSAKKWYLAKIMHFGHGVPINHTKKNKQKVVGTQKDCFSDKDFLSHTGATKRVESDKKSVEQS